MPPDLHFYSHTRSLRNHLKTEIQEAPRGAAPGCAGVRDDASLLAVLPRHDCPPGQRGKAGVTAHRQCNFRMTIHSRETGECLALTRGVVENRHCI